ncbi:MAG: carbohydrate-binding family 9-like protein [Chthonomonadales bacterium]
MAAIPTYRCKKLCSGEPDTWLRWEFWASSPDVRWLRDVRGGAPRKISPRVLEGLFRPGGAPHADVGECRTAVVARWSPRHLYVAFLAADTYIWRTWTQRDDPLYDEEVVEIFLAPRGELTRYFELELNPGNVLFDAEIRSPNLERSTMTVEPDWDCAGLETQVHATLPVHGEPWGVGGASTDIVHAGVWIGLWQIPWSGLGEPEPQPGAVWRGNFYRIDRGPRDRYLAWSATLEDPPNFHVPRRFGRIVFGA